MSLRDGAEKSSVGESPLCAQLRRAQSTRKPHSLLSGPSGLLTFWWEATPSDARVLLEHFNGQNRPFTPTATDELVDSILGNLWVHTHQGIAASEVGVVLDGQHRLAAIARSGKNTWILVTMGLTKEGQKVTDIHRPRPLYQQWQIASVFEGFTNRQLRQIEAISTQLARVNVGALKGRVFRNAKEEVATFHLDAIRWVLHLPGNDKCLSAILSGFVYGQHFTTRPFLEDFYRALRTGISTNPEMRGALALKRYIEHHPAQHTGEGRSDIFRATVHVILRSAKGDPPDVVRPPKRDLPALPLHAQVTT